MPVLVRRPRGVTWEAVPEHTWLIKLRRTPPLEPESVATGRRARVNLVRTLPGGCPGPFRRLRLHAWRRPCDVAWDDSVPGRTVVPRFKSDLAPEPRR